MGSSAAGTGLSSLGRWATDLNSLPGDSLEVVVECNQGQQTPEKVANQEEGPMANVIMGQILESSSLNSSMSNQGTDSSETSSNDATILDTAWEETFGDLFPDLGECTF